MTFGGYCIIIICLTRWVLSMIKLLNNLMCTCRHLFESRKTQQVQAMIELGLYETIAAQNKDVKIHVLSNWISVTYKGFYLSHGVKVA